MSCTSSFPAVTEPATAARWTCRTCRNMDDATRIGETLSIRSIGAQASRSDTLCSFSRRGRFCGHKIYTQGPCSGRQYSIGSAESLDIRRESNPALPIFQQRQQRPYGQGKTAWKTRHRYGNPSIQRRGTQTLYTPAHNPHPYTYLRRYGSYAWSTNWARILQLLQIQQQDHALCECARQVSEAMPGDTTNQFYHNIQTVPMFWPTSKFLIASLSVHVYELNRIIQHLEKRNVEDE